MIFPDVRLSDLRKDAELKRANLNQSVQAIKSSLEEFRHPLALIKKHPFKFLGGLGVAAALIKTVGKLFKARWVGKLASFGGIILMKKFLPLVTNSLMAKLKRP